MCRGLRATLRCEDSSVQGSADYHRRDGDGGSGPPFTPFVSVLLPRSRVPISPLLTADAAAGGLRRAHPLRDHTPGREMALERRWHSAGINLPEARAFGGGQIP
jgi:hypothetical protein